MIENSKKEDSNNIMIVDVDSYQDRSETAADDNENDEDRDIEAAMTPPPPPPPPLPTTVARASSPNMLLFRDNEEDDADLEEGSSSRQTAVTTTSTNEDHHNGNSNGNNNNCECSRRGGGGERDGGGTCVTFAADPTNDNDSKSRCCCNRSKTTCTCTTSVQSAAPTTTSKIEITPLSEGTEAASSTTVPSNPFRRIRRRGGGGHHNPTVNGCPFLSSAATSLQEKKKITPVVQAPRVISSSSAASSCGGGGGGGSGSKGSGDKSNNTANARWGWRRYQMSAFITSVLVFAVLCGSILMVCVMYANAEEDDVRLEAQELARNAGAWFSEQLDQAVMPLFSVAQFATELEIFQDLPSKIGDVDLSPSTALPFVNPEDRRQRNVTGVCDDVELNDRYNQIASTVMKHSKMERVLEKLNLAPQGVVCLMQRPTTTWNTTTTTNATSTNSENRDDDDATLVAKQQQFDPMKGWGMDLINDPVSRYAARAALKGETVLVEGPRPIRQCMECDPYFIARLPIPYEGHVMIVDGEPLQRWGFATALINWKVLQERSGMQSIFEEKGYEFRLTRTDQIYNTTTQVYDTNIVVLAQSQAITDMENKHKSDSDEEGGGSRYDPNTAHTKIVTTALQTTNNEWELTVYYDHVGYGQWRYWVIPVCVLISFGVACLVYTVIVQKHIQASMAGDKKAQDARVEMERNMTAYFAHELRNPLGAIDSALNAMPDDLPSPGPELVSGMQLCAGFMSAIMNNLLDVRELEEGQLRLRSDPMSLKALVTAVQKMLEPSLRPNVRFIVDCQTITTPSTTNRSTTTIASNDNDWVLGDFHRIQQVLTNVATNAIKYTVSGSITLRVSWRDDVSSSSSNTTNRMVQFECIDTGPGIPKDEQEKMFEKFVKRGGAPGTGLGLSIARSIVNTMEGTIRFDSDPTIKPGTTCTILLPLQLCQEQPEETSNGNSDGANTAGGNSEAAALDKPLEEALSFLVIDDIKMNRTMLKRRIHKGIAPNSTITEASTGEEALQICANTDQRFDVVIVDQYMGEAGGVLVGTDVVIAMRRMGIDSLIIGCSGNDLDAEFCSAGADYIWKKPMPSNAQIIRQLREGMSKNV